MGLIPPLNGHLATRCITGGGFYSEELFFFSFFYNNNNNDNNNLFNFERITRRRVFVRRLPAF